MKFFSRPTVTVVLSACCLHLIAGNPEPAIPVGAARIDITPPYPIRLSGYAVRKTESAGVEQRLWAKALAIGSDRDGPAILITVDNCGVPANVTDEVAARLWQRARIPRERIAVCSSHAHTGPCLTGVLPNLFVQKIPADQQATIDRYTRELIDQMEQAALRALADRRPCVLAFGQGKAYFAANRRTPGGPVDHDLPVLRAVDTAGHVRAIVANYACHCTTLGGDFNRVCGDWAGYAQADLESDNPGAIALVAIGCGADANPQPRGKLELAAQHGRELASEADRVLTGGVTILRGKLTCRFKVIDLPFDPLPTRAQWEERAQKPGIVGYHARVNLDRLARGETLPATLPYRVQTWTFGNELAMVFLSGEVVVDYSLRLKQEFDATRLWVNGYANDVPCYIPSRRVLAEGGYEAEESLWYYDRPARLSPETEDRIIHAVHELLPADFLHNEHQAEFPPPKSPADALASLRTDPGLVVDLAVAEPLVVDPVAIDWGADGKLWVVEMRDYPAGMDGHYKAGGRIKCIEDTAGDGRYDKATVFLDNLPFPTGVMAWRKGVLICAAPDIWYAEDTDGDGKADVVKKLFTGFATHNYQARVNGLSYGLDNWIYGASGLFGGKITSLLTGQQSDVSGRDFRLNADTGAFEPAAGLSQQGRVRDDWGNWFGCDNSTLIWHFPLPDHYVRRNPHFTPPEPRVYLPNDGDPNQLYPASRTLRRFNDPQSAHRVTSGCGLGIYRDDLLGPGYYGNAFFCEPVHNLVYRMQLEPSGATFTAHRPADEQHAEFLASTDNWFRPVQVRTGPDGALWIVDIYRFVIEHPRWITPDRLAQLDVRAGEDKGRIYRVYPRDARLRSMRNLRKLSATALVAALDSPNGSVRDLVQEELTQRGQQPVVRPLIKLAQRSTNAVVRAQALCALDGLRALSPALLQSALVDASPGVRRQATRVSEGLLQESPALAAAVLKLAGDPDSGVRFQAALSLGAWRDPRAGRALGELAVNQADDLWLRAAVLSSARFHADQILQVILQHAQDHPALAETIGQLIATAVASDDRSVLERTLIAVVPSPTATIPVWQWSALASLLDALKRQNLDLDSLRRSEDAEVRAAAQRIETAFGKARQLAANQTADPTVREPAVRLLARDDGAWADNLRVLDGLLQPSAPLALQNAAVQTLGRYRRPEIPQVLLAGWPRHSPALRNTILDVLLAREEWATRFLDALEKGTVPAGDVSTPIRNRLLKHAQEKIRRRAALVLAANRNESRADLLSRYQDVPRLTGDPAHGAELFSTNCATCHAFRGQGHEVGPNLAALTDKSPQYLMTAILDPNAAVEDKYKNYFIETKDGRSLSGIISGETATSLTLVKAEGSRESILRGDVDEIRASNLSLMPEGFEQVLPPQALADVIAYLEGGPATIGDARAGNTAAARAQFLAGGVNGVARIVFAAERLSYGSWLGVLPMPLCRQTDRASKLVWETAPVSPDLKPDAVQQFRLPAAMGYVSQPAGRFSLKLNGKPVLDFDAVLTDQAWESADRRVRMIYTVKENDAEDGDGVLVIEVRGSLLEPGRPATFEVDGSPANSQRWFGVYLLPSASVNR
ncbi:MAG: neutral/alkaline non-lysosomal ceramidase N-terminal domain-containing protein [Limisphaerales bacterium]